MEKILFFCSGQHAFWKQFDAWQTDSCTVGDDFFMHMIGSWWKNPVDVYPNGLLGYAGILNNQRVNEIKQTNANLQHLKKHLEDNLAISTEEIEQMVQAKVGEHPNATAAEKKALTQHFFQAWAIQWGTTYNLDYLKAVKESDVHSQSRERTNGVVRNIDEWYDAFDITSGTLYLSPDKRVTIW